MATEGFTNSSQFGDGSSTPKSAIFIVVGEPSTDAHRDLILAEITKGFKGWDKEVTEVDINDELSQIANRASLGEEGPNGERLIRHSSDNVAVEILINPQTQSVTNSLKSFLILPVQHKFLLFAGHAFQGSGDWVLQDGVFTFKKLTHILNDTEVETALKQQQATTLTMYCSAVGDWNSNISKQEASKVITLNVNPPEKLDSMHGVLQFTTYIGSFVKTSNLTDILPASDVIGNIGFNKPTLYIFPGCQGDSALFGIKGFNLLVNAGFNRKACFWDFTRHLDRIDAVLLTHLGTDNLFGISSVLKRKCLESAHPEIGYIYMNAIDQTKPNGNPKEPSLLINLADEGNDIIEMSKQLGVVPHPCVRGEKAPTLEPVNLYHKVGHGSLDMYILNPVQDSKELKEFYQQWTKKSAQFGTHQGFPMPNMFSICALLVWKPTNPDEKITRVLFPGNAPQHKIIEGLEKVKTIDVFKHPVCTGKDLLKPAAGAKKGTSASSASRVSARSAPAKAAAPVKKETATKASPTKTTPRSSPPKATKKDDSPRKSPVKTKNVDKEKSDKSKSSASSSPSKGSASSTSPAKNVTPAITPVEPVAPVIAEPEPIINHVPDTAALIPELAAGINGSPEPLPSPEQYNAAPLAADVQQTNDYNKQQLADLGIYDEDDDVGSMPIDTLSAQQQQQGSSVDETEEEIPQNLPEPVAVPMQAPVEPDLIQEAAPEKEVCTEVENNVLDDSIQSEPDLVPHGENQEYGDPAVDIPSSPEPNFEDHDYPAIPPGRTAPLPSFSNEPDIVPSAESVQQNIQYGITDDASLRSMGGIREEDEEEAEREDPQNQDNGMAPQTMEDLGIYEDDEGSQDGNDKGDPSSFVYEKDVDLEDEKRAADVRDEGIENDQQEELDHQEVSNIPEAFERDHTPSLEETEAGEVKQNGNGALATHDDETDSIDGGTPEVEKGMLDMTGKLESLQEGLPISPADPNKPFESLETEGFNPFHGIDGAASQIVDNGAQKVEEFDPLKQWGEPMGLPSPPPPGAAATDKNAKPKPAAAKKTDVKKPSSAPAKKATSSARPSSAASKTNGVDKKADTKKPATSAADKRPASKTRPATAPAKTETSKLDTTKTKAAPARRPATATSRASPAPVKLPPLPALTPFYVDLTYVPNHGESNYCDVEFFKRIRARHYVLSALTPNPEILNALLEAKPTWDNKDTEVMVIPTYDNETLRHWMGLNKEKLSQLKIDVAPSASRCFIQLQDHEANCSAYRLEF
ncbi:microtubule-associated protein 1B isoform X2 [Patella vulgata]|uniref:microtubule-associated protein 1B isoform X2 n=1 Tax=Patella vulgata TaxID=6465 RepID=UPI0024A94C09|nr:microtubule-associated protein 1B isoform X2 [Patella vulgata]